MLDLIREASERIRGVISPTPLIFSSSFTRFFGFDCFLKLENLQKTGSFKVRGAFNRISLLSRSEKKRGVITASSGNHGQGVAWAAGLCRTPAVVVMPETTPIIKRVAVRSYGGEVVTFGRSFGEAFNHAKTLSRKKKLAFIHPFDDELVIAGQGTVGLEVMAELPDADTIVVPVGGGGLISGISMAVKGMKKGVKVIGVEAASSSSCIKSLKAGRPVEAEAVEPTLADGIAMKRVGEKTFPIIRKHVDRVVSVSEDTVAEAILKFMERKKLVVEGAGAVTLAAAMEGKLPGGTRKAVFIVSGGNIDVTTLDRIIKVGLLREGRIMKLTTVIPDVPGSLARLTSSIAEGRGNILHVYHMREAVDVPVGSVAIEVVLEVEGSQHGKKVLKGLRGKGYRV